MKRILCALLISATGAFASAADDDNVQTVTAKMMDVYDCFINSSESENHQVLSHFQELGKKYLASCGKDVAHVDESSLYAEIDNISDLNNGANVRKSTKAIFDSLLCISKAANFNESALERTYLKVGELASVKYSRPQVEYGSLFYMKMMGILAILAEQSGEMTKEDAKELTEKAFAKGFEGARAHNARKFSVLPVNST